MALMSLRLCILAKWLFQKENGLLNLVVGWLVVSISVFQEQ
jgi:hypothetical protein